jgi:hypothetical protein
MSLKDYAVMPYSDYVGACDAIREKDGSSGPIKSGALRSKILSIETGADVSVVTATAPDVLIGKIIVDKNGKPLTGSMPNNNAAGKTLTIDDNSYTIPKGYHNGKGVVSHNIENLGSQNGTISTKAGKYTIPKGYHDGSGTVAISSTEQSKIIADNIKSGVAILGVTGTYGGSYIVITGTVKPTSNTTVVISNSAIKTNSSCKILGGCLYYTGSSSHSIDTVVLKTATTSSATGGVAKTKLPLDGAGTAYGEAWSVYAEKTSGTITMTITESSSSSGFSTSISYNYCIAMSV